MLWLRLTAIVLLFYIVSTLAASPWQKPGCHRVGNTRKIKIPNCVEFHITTNACRGFCESYAVPSIPWSNYVKPNKPVVSVGQCCSMMESEDVHQRVLCLGGMKQFTFKSALSCSCYECKVH
ncbi:thyrostimulin alpha-2 subunit [Episyrphus balteatus]|uniref:thyrostimulin alpha-2 subunit n=1 Tax=Episyrphus balteatus TaxID=286459 RepID=UPI002485209E|nr:thyrostimulin alpha-2 subunit [Episyrphus balteatus]